MSGNASLNGHAHPVRASEQQPVPVIDEVDPVLGPTHDDGEPGRLGEDFALADELLLPTLRGEHGRGRFRADDQDAAYAIGRVQIRNRVVAVCPIDIFNLAVARNRNELVFVRRRPQPGHHMLDLRPDDRPNLRPYLARRSPQRRRMALGADRAAVSVVVEAKEIRPPLDVHGLGGLKDHADLRRAAEEASARALPSGVDVQSSASSRRPTSPPLEKTVNFSAIARYRSRRVSQCIGTARPACFHRSGCSAAPLSDAGCRMPRRRPTSSSEGETCVWLNSSRPNVDAIVDEAVVFSRTLLPAAGHLDETALRDHLPMILKAVADRSSDRSVELHRSCESRKAWLRQAHPARRAQHRRMRCCVRKPAST